jgi:hypothetical protein
MASVAAAYDRGADAARISSAVINRRDEKK